MSPDLLVHLGSLVVQLLVGVGTIAGVWIAISTRVTRLEERQQAVVDRLVIVEKKLDDLLERSKRRLAA